jgi:UDP-glucose 4-epimerase
VLRFTCPLWALKLISVLSETVCRWFGRTSTLNSDKYCIMKQRNWQCDITPAIDELGYHPQYDLERGVVETVAWYKKEGWL